MINRAFSKIYASNIAPDHTMNVIWMDLTSDPYGSSLKYWNGATYAPIFTQGGGANNYAPLDSPKFTGAVVVTNSSDIDCAVNKSELLQATNDGNIVDRQIIEYVDETNPGTITSGYLWYKPSTKELFRYIGAPIDTFILYDPVAATGQVFIYEGRHYTYSPLTGISVIGDKATIYSPTFSGIMTAEQISVPIIINNTHRKHNNIQKVQQFPGRVSGNNSTTTIYGDATFFTQTFSIGEDRIYIYNPNSAQLTSFAIINIIDDHTLIVDYMPYNDFDNVQYYKSNPFVGTVSTSGTSNIVTGSGTLFTQCVNPGDTIRIENGPDGGFEEVEVIRVISDTALVTSFAMLSSSDTYWSIAVFASEYKKSYDSSGILVSYQDLIPVANNALSIGSADSLWSDIWLGTSPHVVSDARSKTPIASLTIDELNASKQIGKEIGTYKLLSSVYEKGDNARLHVGITVQKAIEIMEANNLNPFAYGFICYDSWDEIATITPAIVAKDEWIEDIVEETYDDNGNVVKTIIDTIVHPAVKAVPETSKIVKKAGNIYSLRYEELIMFLLAGIDARLSAIE
jgi:hypothetical protein